MSKSLLKDKKGIFGLNAVQSFFSVILGIALLAYVIVIIMGTLSGTTILSSATGAITNNRTVSAVSDAAVNLPININGVTYADRVSTGKNNLICSISNVVNATSNTPIGAVNYTVSNGGCALAWLNTTSSTTGGLNNSFWNVTYSYTYNTNSQDQTNSILGNTSSGISGFFSSINPVYAILAVLVIILVLVVLVRVVSAPTGSASVPQL